MYEDLNQRQQQTLAIIKKYKQSYGYAPSIRELAKELSVKSTSTVSGYISKLEELGYIRRHNSKNRAIDLVEDDEWRNKEISPIPLVGSVRAGMPVLAEECIDDVYPFPAQFLGSESVFMLQVQGDSMQDEGIYEGDFLFVQQQDTANNGDIVVALVNEDEATVKTFYKETDYIRLQPANDNYTPIISKHVKICGRVIGVYRKYN